MIKTKVIKYDGIHTFFPKNLPIKNLCKICASSQYYRSASAWPNTLHCEFVRFRNKEEEEDRKQEGTKTVVTKSVTKLEAQM